MTEIIGVRFKSGGKTYYFDPQGLQVPPNAGVIVDTSRGVEYGLCVQENTMVEDSAVVQPLRCVLRLATTDDEYTVAQNKLKEEQAFEVCQEKILQHKLDMKLVEVEVSFEGNKILFSFTSDGRVDFRGLVKDLAGIFRARIELRQIGVRDEAKLLGGLGICGRPFCCSSFLDDFQPVSIKMAKTQSLSLNPTKISGTCGRLMCCLKYEQDAYEDLIKRAPKQESFVETPDGVGTVTWVNLLREKSTVRLENQEERQTYHNSELRIVRNGKGKRPENYEAPPLSELAKLRKVTPSPEEEAQAFASTIGKTLSTLSMLDEMPAAASKKEQPRRQRTNNKAKATEVKTQEPKAQPAKKEETIKATSKNTQKQKTQKQQPKQNNKAKATQTQPTQNQATQQAKQKQQPKATQTAAPDQGQTATADQGATPAKKKTNRRRYYRGNKSKNSGGSAPAGS